MRFFMPHFGHSRSIGGPNSFELFLSGATLSSAGYYTKACAKRKKPTPIAAEVAPVAIGGLFKSTLLTLLLIPAIYNLVDGVRRTVGTSQLGQCL